MRAFSRDDDKLPEERLDENLGEKIGKNLGVNFGARIARLVLLRLLPTLLFLWLFSLLLFALFVWLPGDVAEATFGTEGDAQALQNLRSALALDKPVAHRYAAWLASFLKGDWGESALYGLPVRVLIVERLPLSLTLSLASFLFATASGVSLGILLAARRRTTGLLDLSLNILLALPSFLLGIGLILLFAVRWPLLPTGGIAEQASRMAQARHILLPVLALALPQMAILARFANASLRETLTRPFITTARAKGLSKKRVLLRHALPSVAAPLLALSGLQAAFLVSGTVVVESVFALPGLGSLFLNATHARDLPLALALALLFAVATMLATTLAELTATLFDARRMENEEI